MAQEQQQYSETPCLLPATVDYLERLFDRFDTHDFFAGQRPFCTIVLGGPGVVTIDQDDKRSLPWLDERHIGSGAFGSVYEVKIPKNHLTMHQDFNQTNSMAKLVARKDYIVAKNMEENFEKEVKSIREIFSASSKHNNILESFGTLVIRGPEPKFSLLMPLADMDLQKYMEDNPEIPTDDRWARQRIISAAIGLAGGLEFLHSQMTTVEGDKLVCYHMDLKPSNILVFLDESRMKGTGTEDRDYGMIWKLSDFGLSRVKIKTQPDKNLDSLFERKIIDQSTEASPTENLRGNGTYLPIEAQDKSKTMNQKSDIWSLGCVISVLFTYMEEGHSALERYSDSRRKYNKPHKMVDVFYQENRYSRGANLNEAVKAQHTKLIEATKKRNAAEGEAVSYILRYLESNVLVIDQGDRCKAESIVQCLGNTLKKCQTAESSVRPESPTGKPYSLRLKLKEAISPSLRKERSPKPVDIHCWRLDIDKSTRFKDCRSSPNGRLIAYWNLKVIMVFDSDTTISRTNSSSTSLMGLRTTSTEIVQDPALRNVGQHILTGVSSWKSLGMTDSYLVAVTTEAKALECYAFDIQSDQTLRTYKKFTLPYTGFHSLTASPNEDAIACILNDNNKASLLTTAIDTSLPGSTAPSASLSEAGTRVGKRRPIVLDYPTSQIEHLALRTKNEGYIIVRGSSTLSVSLFTIDPPRMVKQNLILGSIGSSVERLFTDMVFFQSGADEPKSEIIVVAQAQQIFHLKFSGTSTAALSVAYLPVTSYRILKIATNGQVVVALGAHSDRNHFVLLEVKLLSPTVRPQLRKIAELKEVSTSCQPKLSVIGDRNEPIALITTATPDGQYRVYQKSLITLANNNT